MRPTTILLGLAEIKDQAMIILLIIYIRKYRVHIFGKHILILFNKPYYKKTLGHHQGGKAGDPQPPSPQQRSIIRQLSMNKNILGRAQESN